MYFCACIKWLKSVLKHAKNCVYTTKVMKKVDNIHYG